GKLGIVEEARAALIEIVEKTAIDPFEIEQQRDRLAHANVGEDRPPRIEDEVGGEFGQPAREGLLDDASVAHGGKIVTGLPAAGIGFAVHVVEAGLKGFEIGVAVAIKIEAQFVEIPQPAIDRKPAAPIIGIALGGDAFAHIDSGDDIGTAAD